MTRLFPHALAALCALSVIGHAPLARADSSGLIALDVIDGWIDPDGTRVAGLRIRVAQGWKTYWRSPGDAGIPPRFDWSDSDNLADVRIHWPRPQVFDTYGQRTLGYGGEVVLPMVLTPADPTRPITLSGHADMGVCSDICVPVQDTIGESATTDQGAIRAGLAAEPKRVAPHQARCAVVPIADGLRLTATLSVPPQGAEEWTVVEVMQRDVWVSEPVQDRNGEALTATADLVPLEAAPFELDPSLLRITVLGPDKAMEAIGCEIG